MKPLSYRPLWVMLLLLAVMTSLEPYTEYAYRVNWPSVDPYDYKWRVVESAASWQWTLLFADEITAGLVRGLTLSTIVLLAAWCVLARVEPRWRLGSTAGCGLALLWIWFFYQERAQGTSMFQVWHVPSFHAQAAVQPRVLFAAPLVLMLFAWLIALGRMAFGWQIADPHRPEQLQPRRFSLGLACFATLIAGLVYCFAIYLRSTAGTLGAPGWLRMQTGQFLREVGRTFLLLLAGVLPGLFWLASVLDSSRRRWLWLLLALALAIACSVPYPLLDRRWPVGLLFGCQLGLMLGVVVPGLLLASFGWQFRRTTGEQAGGPGESSRGFLLENMPLFAIIGTGWLCSLCAPLFRDNFVDLQRHGQGMLMIGMTLSQLVLLAGWAVLSAAPWRYRLPGIVLALLGSLYCWWIAVRASSGQHARDEVSLYDLWFAVGVIGLLAVALFAARRVTDARIVRDRPPKAGRDLSASQFSLLDLLLWSTGIPVLLVMGRWVLTPTVDDGYSKSTAVVVFLAIPIAGLLLSSLPWLVLPLPSQRSKRWALNALAILSAVTLLLLLPAFAMSPVGLVVGPLFLLGTWLGVGGAMTMLAAAGYRLETPGQRKQANRASETASP